MKRILMLLLAAGCSSAPASYEVLKASQLTFDASKLEVGEWVGYTQRVEGVSEKGIVRYACVAREGEAVWIEIKGPAGIVKQKLDRSGKVLEQWTGAPGGVPSRMDSAAAAGASSPRPRRDSAAAREKVLTDKERLTLAGRTFDCTKITTVLAYPDGRESRMVNWCSGEVPFGGLVRRTLGRFTMELSALGVDARPELALPARPK